MLHVDINKSHVSIIMLHVDIIDLAYWAKVCHRTEVYLDNKDFILQHVWRDV